MQSGTTFLLEVNPEIPPRLARLEELANNLWYSWDRPTRSLFARLHPALWDAVSQNPKAFLKRIDASLHLQPERGRQIACSSQGNAVRSSRA